jgi:sodium transport system permease protein
MTVAIDSTAGERERGSLEPLLLNPVPAHDLVMGKWLAAWTFASSVAVLTLAGFVVASLAYAQKKIPALMAFGVHELALFVALIVPFAALTSSLSMLICTYGRSYREAQTYVSYLITVIALLPAVVLFTGLKDEPWQLAVPFLGQLMVMGRVMRGDAIAVSDGLAPACIAFVLAAVCIALLARLLRDERIVFGRT